MLKRIMVALAGLFLMFGLAAAPASGTQAELVGSVHVFELQDQNMLGANEVVQEAEIPSSCDAIPDGLETVRSARNDTDELGTSISFYLSSTCSAASHVSTILPGEFDNEINLPAGAGFWQITP